MATTRTIGPLHFEDLEPKRFEDLVRQLAYEFRPWRRLEATGRGGSDDGFDARGYEIVDTGRAVQLPVDDPALEDEAVLREGAEDRLWLIQCKREKTIGPTKLLKYLEEIQLGEGEKLYGIVFTAACDFTKKARDGFAKKCQAMGLDEWHLWGKAELEDRLFQPSADHLLFAYFGISLTIRRRSQRTELRARLAMKRKAHRVLKDKENVAILLRSPDANYPWTGDKKVFKNKPAWVVWKFRGFGHDGIRFCVQRFFAYISDDGEAWDAAMCVNDARSFSSEDPWFGLEEQSDLRGEVWKFWDTLPPRNRAWLEVVGVIPYEDILDIDELGDDHFSEPQIYVPFTRGKGDPFKNFYATVQPVQGWQDWMRPKDKHDRRTAQFPAEFRDLPEDE